MVIPQCIEGKQVSGRQWNAVKLAITLAILLVAPSHRLLGADQQLHHRPVYTLHVGDVIVLNYRYTPEFNQTIKVQPDGCVNLNIVGNIKVAGLSIDDAHNQIVQKASARLNNPELTITLQEFEHPYVVIAGEVEHPGKFELRDDTTALQAVMLAGGFKDSARDTQVILFRKINADDAEVRKLNLHNVKTKAELEKDTELQPGDMLLVTRNKMEHLARFMKASNLGIFFNPTQMP
ncbi:polysaccharide biosynthesis/export family protein [Terriglobus sp. YAF25]|uniref:polysaccharide biosynthesis/export family protein n=1 Tax=Terriglobus sp. YAF25 TaxID=3233080 RepID=UPI003F9570F4